MKIHSSFIYFFQVYLLSGKETLKRKFCKALMMETKKETPGCDNSGHALWTSLVH